MLSRIYSSKPDKRMINKHNGVDLVSSYITDLFNKYQHHSPFLVYHNLQHTQTVVKRSAEIAAFYQLDDSEMFVLLSAAWFHDVGHLFGPSPDHELRGVIKMKEYMETIAVDEHTIQNIASCILSTRLPSNPKNLLEEILCDADLYHLGTNEFYVTDMLVKKEYELRNDFIAKNWYQNSLYLLRTHKFYTGYCRDLLNKGKLENITLLLEKLDQGS